MVHGRAYGGRDVQRGGVERGIRGEATAHVAAFSHPRIPPFLRRRLRAGGCLARACQASSQRVARRGGRPLSRLHTRVRRRWVLCSPLHTRGTRPELPLLHTGCRGRQRLVRGASAEDTERGRLRRAGSWVTGHGGVGVERSQGDAAGGDCGGPLRALRGLRGGAARVERVSGRRLAGLAGLGGGLECSSPLTERRSGRRGGLGGVGGLRVSQRGAPLAEGHGRVGMRAVRHERARSEAGRGGRGSAWTGYRVGSVRACWLRLIRRRLRLHQGCLRAAWSRLGRRGQIRVCWTASESSACSLGWPAGVVLRVGLGALGVCLPRLRRRVARCGSETRSRRVALRLPSNRAWSAAASRVAPLHISRTRTVARVLPARYQASTRSPVPGGHWSNGGSTPPYSMWM